MNHEEQTLIDGLFDRLQHAERDGAPRDVQAQARITERLQQQSAAPYYMAQAILVQEAAIKRLDEQNRQLQAELNQARAQLAATAPSGGGFLSSIFGGGTRQPEQRPQQPPAASGGAGWREPSQGFNPPPQAVPAQGGASSFLGGALQTAAGVAGGVMLAQGISSLFSLHSAQPQTITEVINEAPASASDSSWGSEEGQGFTADSDYDDGLFSDDDAFV